MQFLKTLFWVVVAVLVLLFAINNWRPVEVRLGDIIVTAKLPVLVFIGFAIGFVPTLIVYWARVWSLRRRLDARDQIHVANAPPAVPARPVPTANVAERQATDSKAWPAG
jgi:lipopolysaccharide assembly protein A